MPISRFGWRRTVPGVRRWATVEAGGDLGATVRAVRGTVLLDSLGPWLATRPGFAAEVDEFCTVLRARAGAGDTVIVSDEVGLGAHPASEAGRAFRDALGSLNQAVAAVADRVLLVVAGRVLTLDDEI